MLTICLLAFHIHTIVTHHTTRTVESPKYLDPLRRSNNHHAMNVHRPITTRGRVSTHQYLNSKAIRIQIK